MQVTSKMIIAMTTGSIYVKEHNGKENGINEILKRNAEALNKILYPMFIEYRPSSFKLATKRPVVVRAKIEQLIKEGKMNQGQVTQLERSVIYKPRNTYITKPLK